MARCAMAFTMFTLWGPDHVMARIYSIAINYTIIVLCVPYETDSAQIPVEPETRWFNADLNSRKEEAVRR